MNDITLSEKQLQDKGVLMQELGATNAQAEFLVLAVEEVVLRHDALTSVAQVLVVVSSQK
jgi:hypothetical protein